MIVSAVEKKSVVVEIDEKSAITALYSTWLESIKMADCWIKGNTWYTVEYGRFDLELRKATEDEVAILNSFTILKGVFK